jgi:hypothetical protein
VRPLGDDGGESPLHLFVDDAVLRQDTLRIMAAGEIDDAVVDLLQHPGKFLVASPLPLDGIGFREGGNALEILTSPASAWTCRDSSGSRQILMVERG